MKVKNIDLDYKIIEDNFKLDKDLIYKYHIESGNDYKKCSLRTYNDLLKADNSFNFYGVFEGTNLIGFFGTEYTNYVNTIFVKPEYRNRRYMKKFFSLVKSKVDNEFYTALYKKNKRAINFYLKNNGNIVEDNKEYVIIKMEGVCQ